MSIVTSSDVARAANVSQSTVSLVLNGKGEGRISPATRQLVEETAAKLGYRPNASAQILRTGISKTFAFAVPNVVHPYFGQVLVAAELAARAHDFSVLLVDTTTDPLWSERLVSMLRSRLIAGCIVYSPDIDAESRFAEVKDSVVVVEGETAQLPGFDLSFDTAFGTIVNHLVGLGHSRIGHFGAFYPKATFRSRHDAFLAALRRAGLVAQPDWHVTSTFEIDGATEAAKTLIGTGVTAIACDDDLLAASVYRAARQLNVPIPTQLSVVGFNDVEMARVLHPELTTVRIPIETVGQEAVHQLMAQLKGRSTKFKRTLINLELVVRDSTTGPADHR